MNVSVSLPRRMASLLMTHARRVVSPARIEWAQAMQSEFAHIDGDFEALRWAVGCVIAAYIQRNNDISFRAVVKKPSALLPIAMSLTALSTLLMSFAMFGVVHSKDEGGTAHIWQLLMAGQTPVILFFAVKWLPRAPRHVLCVLAIQAGAALGAMAPVFFLHL